MQRGPLNPKPYGSVLACNGCRKGLGGLCKDPKDRECCHDISGGPLVSASAAARSTGPGHNVPREPYIPPN